VNVYAEFLNCLEHARSIDARVISAELRGCASPFAARRWIVPDGYQTSILAPVLNCEEEVDVVVDQERGTFRYRSPAQPRRFLTRSLDEIAIYAFDVDAWLDAIADAFEFENAHRARRRLVIDGHLWHLGNLRVGRTHHFAPIYVARRLTQCADDWRKQLIDTLRPSHGIVLTAGEVDVDWPNGHQRCGIDDLLIASGDGIACDIEVLGRLLRGVPANAADTDEWFDERTGELKLVHMAAPRVFKGKQKAVIATFWKARDQASIKWSDVVTQTRCSKDPDSALGSSWNEWIEKTAFARYRIRSRRLVS
jgi:hypothetical protein